MSELVETRPLELDHLPETRKLTSTANDMELDLSPNKLNMVLDAMPSTLHSSPPLHDEDEDSRRSTELNGERRSEGEKSNPQTRRHQALMKSVKAITSMYKVGSLITPSGSTDEEAYQLDGVINWGRTGVVYRATRIVKGVVVEDRSFALKIMWFTQEGSLDNEEQRKSYRFQSLPVQSLGKSVRTDGRERARNELEALLSAQAIPHIIRLHQAFETAMHGVFVFEFVPGSVRMLVNTFGGIAEKDARYYLRDILCALDALHQIDEITSLVHGDVKPENILITDANEAILIDFGSAVRCPRKKGLRNEGVSFVGSLPYTPPEAVDFVIEHYLKPHQSVDMEEVDMKSSRRYISTDMSSQPSIDIWSFGVTTLDLVLGSCPFDVLCDDIREANQALQVVTDPLFLEALYNVIANVISEECLDFLKACLEPQASKRPSAQVLLQHPFLRESAIKRPATLRDVFIDHKLRRSTRGLFGGALTQRSADTMSGTGRDLYRQAYDRYTVRKEATSRESIPESRKRASMLDLDRFVWITKLVKSRPKTAEDGIGTQETPKGQRLVSKDEQKSMEVPDYANRRLSAHMTSDTLDDRTDDAKTEVQQAKSADEEEQRQPPITKTARGWLRRSAQQDYSPPVWKRWWRSQKRSISGPQEARDIMFDSSLEDYQKEECTELVTQCVSDLHLATSPPCLGLKQSSSVRESTSNETMQSCITGDSNQYLSLSPASIEIDASQSPPPAACDEVPKKEVQWISPPPIEKKGGRNFTPLQFLTYLRGRQASEDFDAVESSEVPRRHHLATMTDEDFALVEGTYISDEEPRIE